MNQFLRAKLVVFYLHRAVRGASLRLCVFFLLPFVVFSSLELCCSINSVVILEGAIGEDLTTLVELEVSLDAVYRHLGAFASQSDFDRLFRKKAFL